MIQVQIRVLNPTGQAAPVDPDRLFADDGACLHYTYTTFAEAERVLRSQWLGSRLYRVQLDLRDARNRRSAGQTLILEGFCPDALRLLTEIGVSCDATSEQPGGYDVGICERKR